MSEILDAKTRKIVVPAQVLGKSIPRDDGLGEGADRLEPVEDLPSLCLACNGYSPGSRLVWSQDFAQPGKRGTAGLMRERVAQVRGMLVEGVRPTAIAVAIVATLRPSQPPNPWMRRD